MNNTNKNKPRRTEFVQYTDTQDFTTFAIVQEYCRLSKLEDPSEKDLDRITAILELAQFDLGLSCLLNEADHLIAYEMGLSKAPPSRRGDDPDSFKESISQGKCFNNH